MAETIKEKKRGWLNRRDMAASCGITPQGFDLWCVEPVARIGREAFFTVADVIANRVEKESSRVTISGSVEEETAQARLDKLSEETRKLRLQNSVMEGNSIPAHIAGDIVGKVLSQTGVILDTLAPNIHRRHPELEKRVIDGIEVEIVKHMNEIARMDEYLEKAIDDVIEAAEKGAN
jgi:phage terminase Nu1 subunit (DNA packaging protein)